MSIMTIGDYAILTKPTQNYDKGTHVQIASVNVLRNQVHYDAVPVNTSTLISRLPASYFVFVRPGTDTQVAALISLLSVVAAQRKVSIDGCMNHRLNCTCDRCLTY